MANFIEAEELIRQYLKVGAEFNFEGVAYIVKMSGKPKPQRGKGEPKTDIYVCADSDVGEREFRISYKKENADFLENKMGESRAEQIFGTEWAEIIKENTKVIEDEFKKVPLIYWDKKGRTEEGSMTLGWRFELFNKLQGGLSGIMKDMSYDQVFEVYAGQKLEKIKRDAKVNNIIIPNSGVAEFILVDDNVSSAQDIVDKMEYIKDYIKAHPDVYFGCKALNYRSKKKKIEGNRALSVQVDWFVKTEVLEATIEFEHPLTRKGNEMKRIAESCLRIMKKQDATCLGENDIKDINVYKK